MRASLRGLCESVPVGERRGQTLCIGRKLRHPVGASPVRYGHTRHTRHARSSHFGPPAKGAPGPLRQDGRDEQVRPSQRCSISSAVPPAVRGVDRRDRPGPADPSLSTHQRRSAPRPERGRYRDSTFRARDRPPRPYVGSRPRTDLVAASLGRRELVRPGRGSLPVRPHLPLALQPCSPGRPGARAGIRASRERQARAVKVRVAFPVRPHLPSPTERLGPWTARPVGRRSDSAAQSSRSSSTRVT